jgi:hypothetical protein
MGFDLVAKVTGNPESTEVTRSRKGGDVRASNLTQAERTEIAKKAAETRWAKRLNSGAA